MTGGRGDRASCGEFDRGQTLIDYSLGIGLFLVSVAIVLTFIPSILAPFSAPIDDSVATRADRSAETLTYALSTNGQPNILNTTDTRDFFQTMGDADDLREYLGLARTSEINVTIHDPATEKIHSVGATPLAAGDPKPNQPIAASSRIVTLGDEVYRLTVRVW